MVKFLDVKPSVTLKEIEDIENYAGLIFPKEYREHLLKFNGGRCDPNVFGFVQDGIKTESCVNWFLAAHEGKYDNLKDYIFTLKIDEKRMPTHILPIADDPGGNQICVSCGVKDYGYMYFWDHENEVDYSISDDDDYSNLHLIAKSFNEFLNGLTDGE